MRTYVFFDIEVSKDANKAKEMEHPPIISIFAQPVDADTGKLIDDAFFERIKFRVDRADKEILEKVHYSEELWKDAKSPKVVASMFASYLDKYKWYEKPARNGNIFKSAIMAGHNIKFFDLPVLLNWYKAVNSYFSSNIYLPTWYYPHVDTLSMLQSYDAITCQFQSSNSLSAIAKRMYIDINPHDPKSDTLASIDVWRKITKSFISLG